MTTNPTTTTLADPDTPFAVVDVHKSLRNIERLAARADQLGVTLRPHVKTAKSLDVAALLHDTTPCPVTVSTLAEAEAFADGGYTDIAYDVGIDPHKIPRVIALLRRGVTLRVLLDSTKQAELVADAALEAGLAIPTQIEIDCDGHRGGLKPNASALPDIGRILHDAGCLDGVLAHAGESYYAYSAEEQRLAAKNERDTAVATAERLRAVGLSVDTVSIGSTPTAHAADDLCGVTELRAGNCVFLDLVMAGLGVCRIDDVALSVTVTAPSTAGSSPTAAGWPCPATAARPPSRSTRATESSSSWTAPPSRAS